VCQAGLSTRRWVWIAGWITATWAVVRLVRTGACGAPVDLVLVLAGKFVTNL